MKKYRNIVLFLIKFFATYFILFAIYSFYLHQTQEKDEVFVCAPITTKVAEQATNTLQAFGHNANFVQHEDELSVKVLIDDVYLARVIEGCNSISIIVLFIAFIFAFSGKVIPTILYAIIGSLIIYSINIFRISFLVYMLKMFPEKQTILHDLVFPAIIYGTTFLLWVIWVNKFSKKKNDA
ncbi:exosortase family protein XrtF [Lutibacter sp. Hel_I_33_5]|uniref:exosortase family protein XrtF n=1 Tax=Lutibacter sp. Hel_I_33_5 TaxID=1566289 RepID=UPI0011AA010F|nr:exosortase family protein XrtF [Lutibacter sp. Hel_I_33_5]TVZ56747.1 exosortase family protein XrtF [Lutibacter sp. Hel_I_33_5]